MATLMYNGDPAAQQRRVSQTFPLGPTVSLEGTNFSVFSSNATRMEIAFFDHVNDPRPSRVIELDPLVDRTSHSWHIFVAGIKPGQLYGYRVEGPFDPAKGHRFDSKRVLIDPYGKSVAAGPH
ncbi:MAG: hypothetical protein M3Y72_17300 [Acidobacteriota bacterium]|nr:hypothetical protein [Acidobacteriota bacterium]